MEKTHEMQLEEMREIITAQGQALADLRQAIAEGRDLKTVVPVKIDFVYLCPGDPHYQKIIDQGGMVLPEDGPTHRNGWITKVESVSRKHQTFGQNGRPIEFETTHQVAVWKCQTCGAEKTLDPYQ